MAQCIRKSIPWGQRETGALRWGQHSGQPGGTLKAACEWSLRGGEELDSHMDGEHSVKHQQSKGAKERACATYSRRSKKLMWLQPSEWGWGVPGERPEESGASDHVGPGDHWKVFGFSHSTTMCCAQKWHGLHVPEKDQGSDGAEEGGQRVSHWAGDLYQ